MEPGTYRVGYEYVPQYERGFPLQESKDGEWVSDPLVDDLEAWFEAGVAAVGTMSMVRPDLVRAGDLEAISQTVGSMLAKVEKIRSKRE